jgi:hypothetical protein
MSSLEQPLEQITLKLPSSLRAALAQAAYEQRRTVSNLARLLLEQGLEQCAPAQPREAA